MFIIFFLCGSINEVRLGTEKQVFEKIPSIFADELFFHIFYIN